MRIFIWALAIVLIGILIYFLKDCKGSMAPAPRSIHGLYSLQDYDLIYTTKLPKDSLLHELERDGLVIKSGRLHDYDPPWDSLRYLIDNITCDAQRIEPYIEFHNKKQNGLTVFKILWINAPPNESDDTTVYRRLTKKYYDCFEAILMKHGVQH